MDNELGSSLAPHVLRNIHKVAESRDGTQVPCESHPKVECTEPFEGVVQSGNLGQFLGRRVDARNGNAGGRLRQRRHGDVAAERLCES